MTEYTVCCREGTSAVLNKESGQVACFQDGTPSLSRVEVTGTKNRLRADGTDSLQVTFTFIAEENGKDVPFTDGIVSLASSNVKSPNNAYTSEILGNTVYRFSPSQGKMDSNGNFKTTLMVEQADIRDSTKVKDVTLRIAYDKGYDASNPKTYHEFTLDVPPITIKGVTKENPTQPVQQDSWGIFTIAVEDAANQKKTYTISSPVGAIRIDAKSKTGSNTKTTTDNQVQFAWQAPHISKDLKMDVAAELATIDRKAVGSILEGASKDKLDKVLKVANPALGEGVEFLYQGGLKAGQTAGSIDSTKKSVEEHFPGAAQAYEEGRYQMMILESGILLIDGYNFIDGAIGFVTSPLGGGEFDPADATAKASLNWIRDYSELVTRIDKAANSKEITQTYPLTIQVSAGGPAITKTIRVPVVGEAVLWRGKDLE